MLRKKSGSAFLALALCFSLLAPVAQAALYASLDRYSIALGDTVRLTLRSDGDGDPADADLSALQDNFEILQRSSSVSTRIVNGERSQNRELLLDLTPRREGDVVIPPFEVDGERSEALAVTIAPPPKAEADDEIVTFEAEVDRDRLFVQGQLLLTLRVQQAVNLESRSITELDLDNAFVETLGQNSFQRMIDGRPWLVHEIRYAIFPEASGQLRIPAQTFTGRMGSGRRTLFDTRPSGRLIRRQTEGIVIPVLPRPADFPKATWLPAADLSIEEQWSGDLDNLRIGDSVTRTVTLSATGLQGAQLPPLPWTGIDGLRAYPDQPNINDVKDDSGITGVRSDSVALVAVGDGEFELPAVEVPWWDTGSNTLRVARLPARRVRVLPNAPPPGEIPGQDAVPAASAASAPAASPGAWRWISVFCALGWIVTSLGWWRSRKTPTREAPTERKSPQALLRACRAGDASLARRELLAWLRGQAYPGSLACWLREQGSPELSNAVDELEAALYRGGAIGGNEEARSEAWDGSRLAAAIEKLGTRRGAAGPDDLPALYPSQ
ncbi:MAG: BatD family protein [Pseudomonadota bacterium]